MKNPKKFVSVGYTAVKRMKREKLINSLLFRKAVKLFLVFPSMFVFLIRLMEIVYMPRAAISIPMIVGKKLGPVITSPPD